MTAATPSNLEARLAEYAKKLDAPATREGLVALIDERIESALVAERARALDQYIQGRSATDSTKYGRK